MKGCATHPFFNRKETKMLTILTTSYDNCTTLLKRQCDKFTHLKDYLEIILSSMCEMFEYNTIDFDIIDINNIEMILRTWGTVGFILKDNKIEYGFAYVGGKRNKRGIGNKITIQFLDGSCEIVDRESVVLGFNNSTRQADRIIYWFASQFTETDISQRNNVLYSRQAPLFVAKTSKIKQFIVESLKRITKGELVTIADDSLTKGTNASVEAINLTDVASIDKLQYLDTYHNALLRRIYTLYGMPLAEGMKLAQQSVEEVNSNTDSSKIIPLNNLKMRKEMCKNLRDKFGVSIDVNFSELMGNKINTDVSEV